MGCEVRLSTVPNRTPRTAAVLLAAIAFLAPSTAPSQTFDVLRTFETPPINPFGTVIEGSDGALYGTAYKGGPYDAGKVFKINKDGSGFTTLHDFDGIDGIRPRAPVMEASDGMLYGMSESSAFRINKDGTGFLKLYTFTGGNNGVNGP